jgi:hypothetical protein
MSEEIPNNGAAMQSETMSMGHSAPDSPAATTPAIDRDELV